MDRRSVITAILASSGAWRHAGRHESRAPAGCPYFVIDPCEFPDGPDQATAAGAAVQAALAQLADRSGLVLLRPGTFELTPQTRSFAGAVIAAGLWLPSGCALIGSGPGTLLRLKGDSGGVAVANRDFEQGTSDLLIQDVTIESPAAGPAPGYFRQVTADQYHGHGILLVNAHRFHLARVHVRGVAGAGFYLANFGPAFDPAVPQRFAGSDNGVLRDCLATQCGSYGFWLNGTGTRDNRLVGCIADRIGGATLVPGSFSPGHAFLLDSNVFFSQLENCTVRQGPLPPTDHHGIFLTGNCSYNQINNCLIDGSPGAGIAIGSGCNHNVVSGCRVQNVTGRAAIQYSAPSGTPLPTRNILRDTVVEQSAGAALHLIRAPNTQVDGLGIGHVFATPSPADAVAVTVLESPDTRLTNVSFLWPAAQSLTWDWALEADSVSLGQADSMLESLNALRPGRKGLRRTT